MAGCAKDFLITRKQLAAVLRGETRIRNLPADAEVVAMRVVGDDFAVRACSAQFHAIPTGGQVPVVIATTTAPTS